MPHDDDLPLSVRTALAYSVGRLQQIRMSLSNKQVLLERDDDDLMAQAATRRRKMMVGARDYAEKNKLLVGAVTALFTVLTLGGFRIWRSRK